MQNRRKFLKRTFAKIWFYMFLIALLLNGSLWLGLHLVTEDFIRLYPEFFNQPRNLEAFQLWLQNQLNIFYLFVIPGTLVFLLIFGTLIWFTSRSSLNKWLPVTGVPKPKKELAKPKKERAKPKKERAKPAEPDSKPVQMDIQRRLYLHLFSVLQREGRLMDFLAEDLSLYEDDQIGAAVRTIHQHSKKVVDKYLAPKPIIEQAEGEELMVPVGFNPAEIKLTGNVTGEPPFKGVLRHKGWRAAKLELPSLSGGQDPKIIAAAEVEIQ